MAIYAGSDSLESYYPPYVGEASFAPIQSDLAPYQPVASPQSMGAGWLTAKVGAHPSVGAGGLVGIALLIGAVFVALHLWERYL